MRIQLRRAIDMAKIKPGTDAVLSFSLGGVVGLILFGLTLASLKENAPETQFPVPGETLPGDIPEIPDPPEFKPKPLTIEERAFIISGKILTIIQQCGTAHIIEITYENDVTRSIHIPAWGDVEDKQFVIDGVGSAILEALEDGAIQFGLHCDLPPNIGGGSGA